MGNSWTQEDRKETDEFADIDIHAEHNRSNSLSCSCSFCCSRRSVIDCDRNEALMQVSLNLNKRQITPNICNADVNTLQETNCYSFRKTESEVPQCSYFDTLVSKESVANNTYYLPDYSSQEDEILCNSNSVIHEEQVCDSKGQEVRKSLQLEETTGAFHLPSRESRTLDLDEDYSIARAFKDKIICPLEAREDSLVLERIRNVQSSFENCDSAYPIFNKLPREVLLGDNLIGYLPFVCENLWGNLRNFNAHIFAEDMMEGINMTDSLDGANLCRQIDVIEVSSQNHALDETLSTNRFLSDRDENDILPVAKDYSMDAVDGVFIGVIDKVDTASAIASFQWKGKSYAAIISKKKIEYRGRKVGRKLNVDELLVTGQHVTLHINSNLKSKQGNLISSRVILDVEKGEELQEKNYFMSPLYLAAMNNSLGLTSIHATIESVFDTWGTLSLVGGECNQKAIFVSENVYINDFNVPKECPLNVVLYKGMPAVCGVNSRSCDINIKLFLFVGEIVELANNVGIISFFRRGSKEKAVILTENLYFNREKFTSSDLHDVLQLKEKVAFLCIPSETSEIRFKATYLLLCNDRENDSVTFDTFKDHYHYFIDLLSSCQMKCENRVHSTVEMPSVPYNTTNKPPDFNMFIKSEANFKQASQSFMQSLTHFKKCNMSEELQENNNYRSVLNDLGTALVFGGLLWKEYISNKFDTEASSALQLNTVRFIDITGTVYEEGILMSGEMKILFHLNDVYVNGEKCTVLPVGAELHCTATELPHRGCHGETHFAWCLWQGTRPDVQHVFSAFEFKKSDAVTLKENEQYKGQVVAIYPPRAALVRLYIGGSIVPVVVFSNFLQDRVCPFNFEGNHWIIDYISIADCVSVSVQPTKKSNKVAKLGYQWTAVSARKSCSCEIKPQNTRILSRCKRNPYNGNVSFLYKSFAVVTFDTDEGCKFGFFIKDFGMINNEPIGSNVALSAVLTHNSSVTFQKDSIYFVNENIYYISVIYVSGLERKISSKCNTCSICSKKIDKLVDFPVVKHLNAERGVLIDFRDDDGLIECGMYKAVFHKSRLFLSGKKIGSSQVLGDVICKGMTFHFVAVVSEGEWYGLHTSHICVCVWDSQKPGVSTIMESYITDAADGDMLKENVAYFGIVKDIAPPSVALVTINTFGSSIPVLLFISSLAVGTERTLCTRGDWINDYLKIGDKLKVKIASKIKNSRFRIVCIAWKTNDALTAKNVVCAAVKEDTISSDQNFSSSIENQILVQTHTKDESCDMIVNKAGISLPAGTSIDSCILSADCRSKGNNAASQNMKIVQEGSYLSREKTNSELNDMDSDTAEETTIARPVYNAFAQDDQTLVSDLESLGSMLVVGSLLWKEFLAKNPETTNDLSHCRFTDAEVTAIQPVSETTAVLTVAMCPHEPVQAFFNEIDAYNIDANSNDKIYCTGIKLPETGRFKETFVVWLLWQGMPPAVHEVFSVFKTEYSNALVLQDNVQYLGIIVGLLPPYVGLMKIAVSSSVSVLVLIHVNALTACRGIALRNSSGSWIIDYVSVGDVLTVSIESTKNASLKEIGIHWRVKKVWDNNIVNVSSLTLVDDTCTFRGVVTAVYNEFGVVTFETGGYLKRALFFKDQTSMNWQELKAVVTSKGNYEVSFHVKPECFNPKSILWLASNVIRIEERESCVTEDSCVADEVDSFIKNRKIIAFVEKLQPEMGLAVFKLCGRYERASFSYTKIFFDGSQIEPKSALAMLRINMRLSIKIQRITNSEQGTVKYTAEYVEIRPYNEMHGNGTKVSGVTSLTNLLVSKLNVTSGLEDDNRRILKGLMGKIKYDKLGTGIIEFRYKNEDYEIPFDQSTNVLITAQGGRNLRDIWPAGKMVHFNLLCNISMTRLSVECVWENKKPKKIVYKNAPELLSIDRNSIKSGGMYQAKVVLIKKFSFVAEIVMEDDVASVFVTNVSFHPFSDTRKLSHNECVSLHVNKGDVVYVVVERSRNGEEHEWFAIEAWKEAADHTPVPSAGLKALRNFQTGEEAKIITLSPTEGQLQTVAGIVLSFVQEDVYLYGLPLKNVDLTDILTVGVTVNFSATAGSSTAGQCVFVSKVWIGCYEILSFAETYGAIAQYRSSRGWKPHVFEGLMKELGKHRQVESGNMVEQSLQIKENVSDDACSTDDILKNAIGSKSEKHKDLFSTQSTVPKTENTVDAHSNKTYASTLKKQDNILPCRRKDSETSHDSNNASVLDSDVRGIMEMSLYEILCTYQVAGSSEFASLVLEDVENMVQEQLFKKFLPAAVFNAIKHFTVDTSETYKHVKTNQIQALATEVADKWKSRLQVLLENHFHFSDDELDGEKDVELASDCTSSSGEMRVRTNDAVQNIPVITESGTQTTSTGQVIYLNIYADANDEVNHS
ncbi:uncharacterized protein LOC126456387 [Schistocerca serialis cubense]|uniref:uncharacterized protein LOC126456387 n=1 Tax=Schistocerca serialis cubense TaxID=2023355 RepID=UPI00214E574C|nr:uncharacterized protein LOC126456387 [Schistocerca serialis cubense]